MDSSSFSNVDTQFCQLCSLNSQKYTCPRCSLAYCSVDCYKSTSHLDCSEKFYKGCVESEIRSQSYNFEDRLKMIEILKQFYAKSDFDRFNDQINDENISVSSNESQEFIDSDDDDTVPDLTKRLENIDLNNVDDLWMVLTEAEKQKFEAIIRNEKEESFLPQWSPWWLKIHENKLNIIIEGKDGTDYYKQYCPQILEIAPINEVKKASPLICYNLLNILSAYVFMTLHFNGEHESSAAGAVISFLALNDIIGRDAIFEDVDSAIASVLKNAIHYEFIPENTIQTTVSESVKQIIQGPNIKHRTYYMAAVLSDLHKLFTEFNTKFSYHRSNHNSTFTKIFNKVEPTYSNLSKKQLQLYIKKIEYYLEWINKYGMCMCDLNLD